MHITFLAILVWGAFAYGSEAGPLYGLVITVSLFGIVILHELGHSLAAMFFGITVKDIILLPIGGVARLERMPENPWQELVVALAGPLVNVVIFFALLPLTVALYLLGPQTFTAEMLLQATPIGYLTMMLAINAALVIFNMMPAFPLDGGRVFRATLGLMLDYQRATQIAVLVGRGMAVLLAIFAILPPFELLLLFVAGFIYIAAGQEGQAVAVRGTLKQITVQSVLAANHIALTPNATIEQVASRVIGSRQPNYPILDPHNHELLGVASSQALSQAMAQGQWYKSVTEVMHHRGSIPTISLTDSLADAQEQLTETSSKVLAVYDGFHFRGLIDLGDIYRAFKMATQQQLQHKSAI